jgi:hypothetical protein
LDLTKMTPEELAEFLMDWIAQQGGGHGGGITEPLTPEQVLDRIRALVDRGTYADLRSQLEEQGQEIEDLITYGEGIEARMKAAEERALRAEGTLDAFRELVNESVEKDT